MPTMGKLMRLGGRLFVGAFSLLEAVSVASRPKHYGKGLKTQPPQQKADAPEKEMKKFLKDPKSTRLVSFLTKAALEQYNKRSKKAKDQKKSDYMSGDEEDDGHGSDSDSTSSNGTNSSKASSDASKTSRKHKKKGARKEKKSDSESDSNMKVKKKKSSSVKKSKKKEVSSDSDEPAKKTAGPKTRKQKGDFASDSDEGPKLKKSKPQKKDVDADKDNIAKVKNASKKDPAEGVKPLRGAPASGSKSKPDERELERYMWDGGLGYYWDDAEWARTLAYLLHSCC